MEGDRSNQICWISNCLTILVLVHFNGAFCILNSIAESDGFDLTPIICHTGNNGRVRATIFDGVEIEPLFGGKGGIERLAEG